MGKGMTPKKGYNQEKYAENYDSIFRKEKNGRKPYQENDRTRRKLQVD